MATLPVLIAPQPSAAVPGRRARFNLDPDVTRRPSMDDVAEFSLSPTARVSQDHLNVVDATEQAKDGKGEAFTAGKSAAPSIIGDSSLRNNDPYDFNEKLRTKLEQGIKEQEEQEAFTEGGLRGWIVTIGCAALVSVTLGCVSPARHVAASLSHVLQVGPRLGRVPGVLQRKSLSPYFASNPQSYRIIVGHGEPLLTRGRLSHQSRS